MGGTSRGASGGGIEQQRARSGIGGRTDRQRRGARPDGELYWRADPQKQRRKRQYEQTMLLRSLWAVVTMVLGWRCCMRLDPMELHQSSPAAPSLDAKHRSGPTHREINKRRAANWFPRYVAMATRPVAGR
jgi:hypothetical protein